jgi:hypothetical protein
MQTFSLNALAESFEVDRSTIVRAMRGVAPDLVKSGNRPTWKTATGARALEAHRRKQDGGSSGAGPMHQLANKIEANFETFDAGFAKLKAEPDLKCRRGLDEQLGVGKMIGGLDRRMKEANAVLGEGEGPFAFVGDHLIGDVISKYPTLLDYWPSDAEMERLRTGAPRCVMTSWLIFSPIVSKSSRPKPQRRCDKRRRHATGSTRFSMLTATA